MESNISKELIDMFYLALNKAEPYPIEYLEEIGFDDKRFDDDYPEKDRINATLAKKYLLQYGLLEE